MEIALIAPTPPPSPPSPQRTLSVCLLVCLSACLSVILSLIYTHTACVCIHAMKAEDEIMGIS